MQHVPRAGGVRAPVPLTRPPVHMVNNYPELWQRRYAERSYVGVDPTVRHGLGSHAPVIWSDALFANAGSLWDDARDAGLRHGWAQSACTQGQVRGVVTFARGSEPIGAVELATKELRMAWLTQALHLALSARYLEGIAPQASARLTERERAALRWAAIGKTGPEIAQIMRISERTVSFHIANACHKLDAPNRTSAAVTAALLGLLW